MAANEQHRQVEIVVELDEAARALAHLTRDGSNLIDAYRVLTEAGLTVEFLQQIVQ